VNPHYFLFSKPDEQFDQLVADPARRRIAITARSKGRAILFWIALSESIFAIACSLDGKPPVGMFFAAAVVWCIFFKYESDLRLLRAIEQLYQDNRSLTH
jgi:hypothetical protein